MRRRKRPLSLLALSILSFASLVYIVLSFSPVFKLTIYSLKIPVFPLFFLLAFIFIYSLFAFLLNNKRRGFLISLFTIIYLILRLNGLTHIFFAILLIILFGSLELLIVKRK